MTPKGGKLKAPKERAVIKDPKDLKLLGFAHLAN